jgi:hypothetical protein
MTVTLKENEVSLYAYMGITIRPISSYVVVVDAGGRLP